MKRNSLRLLFVLLVVISIVGAGRVLRKAESRSYNLVLITVDALQADRMGVYGYGENTTPRIDEWSKSATVYDNVRAVVPMTHPSLVAFMSGNEPFNTRITSNSQKNTPIKTDTLASILYRYGYSTAAFTTNDEVLNAGFSKHMYLPYKQFYYNEKGDQRYRIDGTVQEYSNFVDKAIDWIIDNKKRKFFAWIHLIDPHAPYIADKDIACTFDKGVCKSLKEQTYEQLEENRATFGKCQLDTPEAKVMRTYSALYNGEIYEADMKVGKILDALKNNDLEKNTIVIISADHGEGFDHNYFFDHRDVLYESAIKIPLIIKYPWVNIQKNKQLIQNNDLFPSILSMVNINVSNHKSDGIDFSSSGPKRKYSISVNSSATKFSITDGKFKYILSSPDSCIFNNQTEELYDLENDPKELHNLSLQDAQVGEKLRKYLLEYLNRYNLPLFNTDGVGSLKPDGEKDNTNQMQTIPY